MKVAIVLALAVLGCTDDEPSADPYKCMAAGGGGCFEMPTQPIAAADATGAAVTPNLACGAYPVSTSAVPVMLSGYTINARTMALTPGVHVEVFSDVALTNRIGETTSSDTGGYSLAIAAMPSLVHLRTRGVGLVPLQLVHQRVDVSVSDHGDHLLHVASREDLAATLESVGDLFLPGKTQLAGVALDCDGNRLVHAIANVAPASAANGSRLFEDGVKVYYARESDAAALDRRTRLHQTTSSGGFAATNLAPGRHFVQVWGFPSESALAMGSIALELLGEVEVLAPAEESGVAVSVYGRASD